MSVADRYYWAGGRKVPLRASTDVVIDVDSEAGAQLSVSELQALREKGRALSPSLLLVAKSDAAKALGGSGSSLPGVHPVFRAEDGSEIVVLPEVRVEGSDPEKIAALGRSLSNAHIKEQTQERLVVEPDSGRGDDALTLANELAESPDTDVAQARFVRIVARPEPR
jgi:hypothetical protein